MGRVVASSISRVHVYRRGATVTRSLRVEPDGDGFPRELSVAGLPLLLDDDSLRVQVLSDGAAPLPRAGTLTVVLSTGLRMLRFGLGSPRAASPGQMRFATRGYR